LAEKKQEIKILIVDDSEHSRLSNLLVIQKLFTQQISYDHNVELASSASEMFNKLSNNKFNLILLDRDLGEDSENKMIDGIELIDDILTIQPNSRVLVITSFDDIKLATKALSKGAMGFITKSTSEEDIKYRDDLILKAVKDSIFEIEALRRSIDGQHDNSGYICESDAMKSIDATIKALSEVKTHVLLLGESGLGKTHAARRLHELSARYFKQSKRPFANINVNAITSALSESQLFGHEKGSFTGATQRTQGFFELADGGDIFLDEIGDATMELQGKLLKVIEEKRFRRIGGDKDIATTARILLATNKDLKKLVKEGTFREDLYSRICAVSIEMPKLNDRKEDIPYISQIISNKFKKENNRNISYSDFPLELKEYFLRDDIPFNIRGIKNDIERLMILSYNKSKDKYDYSSWRSVLNYTSPSSNISCRAESDKTINQDIDSLVSKLVDKVGTNEWPGIQSLKDKIVNNAYLAANSKFTSHSDRAKALGVSKSNVSMKLKVLLSEKGDS
jgi:DNA-binding NtrC family response regulator